MDVARTSMIHAAAPHFLWPFAVQYAAHQINLQPRVSLPETTPTLRWTGKVGDASVFHVWGSRDFVRDTTADKLSSRAGPYPSGVSQVDHVEPVEVAINSGAARGAEPGVAESEGAEPGGAEPERMEPGGAESRGAEPRGAESGGAEPGGSEPERAESGDPLPPQGPYPSGVSQVDHVEPVEVAINSGAARGAEPGVAESEGAEPGGAEPERMEPGGAESRAC
ncbi:unnamed protein product [Closterium sp. NIES-54]